MSAGALIPPATPSLSSNDYRRFCELAYSTCGINLQEGKEQLVTSRLLKVMRAQNITDFDRYYRFVKADTTGKALEMMIDSLTTNHTSFFREIGHFDFLVSRILPEIRDRRQISIWSSACSTGEEPYSLAFTMLDHLGESALPKISILATDISTRVLARASRGLFEKERTASLERDYLRRYFLKGSGQWSDWLMVKKRVRECIDFKRFNLVEGFHQNAIFPLILCRNVMIYFDAKTQSKVVNSLAGCLEPGGYLFIGHSESLSGISHELTFVAPAIYRRSGNLGKSGG